MRIGTDYPHPITVNGYLCRNCDDASKAKRNIDPTQSPETASSAVSFAGALENRVRPSAVSVANPIVHLLDRYA